ncbi:hypothetical protein EI94DRAFT_523574 [Lactarius quietus]|nr:hypothetical protein EI94DRAFT_523574 [Lactarius quietus]
MAPGVSQKNSDPSPYYGWEEYSNHVHHDPLHLYSSHGSYAPLTSENPSVTPKAVSTVDFQYPLHLELPRPFTPLGNQLVKYSSPTFQTVSTQPTLFPIVSAAPSGTSTAPASFYTPPSHHLGLPPASFISLPSDNRLEMSSVPQVRQDIQYRGFTLEATSNHHMFRPFARTEPPIIH